jgi:myo-inositol-hexaphosphate 3-phosphohydrolase
LYHIKHLEKILTLNIRTKIKRLKSKVRKAYNRRKLGVHCTEKLKQLSKQVLAATKSAQEAFLISVLSKEGKCWSDFYKYVKRRKGNRENIPAIKDCNGRIIADSIEKANMFNSNYSTVFSSEGNILHIRDENTGEPFTTDIETIRRRIKAIGKTNQ